MAVGLTIERVTQYCLTRLGYPTVEVELAAEHFTEALEEALNYVAHNRPKFKQVPVSVVAGTVSYDLSAQDTGFAVVDVEIPPEDYMLDTEFDVFNPRIMTHGMDLGDFELGRVYAKTARQVLGADFEWEFNPETSELLISPIPTRSYTAQVVCLDKYTAAEIKSPRVQQWVLRMSLAQCKMILGAIRRKIKSVEGTENTFELDGAELMEEGKAAEEKLLEELMEKSGSFSPPELSIR